MDLVNYKEKYLKYKRKYLEIKGGANCPNIGFYQHMGECWHDALTMLLLYSDGLSEHIQKIFDTTSEYKFDYEDCIKYAYNNTPEYLQPLNIEKEVDYKVFFKNSIDYIRQLYSRYMNDKLPVLPKQRLSTIHTGELRQIEPSFKRFRRNSINESLACVNYIYKITNINLSHFEKIDYMHDNHGGHIRHDFTIIQLFNYFLLNYFPPKLRLKQNMKFINSHVIELLPLDNFFTMNIVSDILFKINEIEKLLDICNGIIIGARFKEVIDRFIENKEIEPLKYQGHALSFIKCGGVEHFYDDNGVENKKVVVDKIHELIKPDIDNPELSIEEYTFRKENILVLKQFNWKVYLKNKIKLMRPILEELDKILKELDKTWLTIEDLPEDSPEKEEIKLKGDEIKLKTKETILSLSECFSADKPDENMPIGKSYLNNFFINSFQIITVNDLDNEENYITSMSNIFKTYNNVYINKRSNNGIDNNIGW